MILSLIKNCTSNIASLLNPFKQKRDDSIVLFGAWFGKRFADNPRYLYQWLSKNKESLGLTHVVWVTDAEDICDELNRMGYEAYLKSSQQSMQYHKKAGIHFICTSPREDIYPWYSNGAVKINLWHGVGGIKGVEFSSPQFRREHPVTYRVKKFILQRKLLRKIMMQPGGWGNCLYLSTTPSNSSMMRRDFARHDDCYIESGLPRSNECVELMPSEEKILDALPDGKEIILYLPTFRENRGESIDPAKELVLKDFIKNHDILWVEKQHSFSRMDFVDVINDYVLRLEPDFDINVLIKKAAVVITDYSSVCWDALYHDIPVIFYTPDFDEYNSHERGIMLDPKDFMFGPRADTPEQLVDILKTNQDDFKKMLPENQNDLIAKVWGKKKDYAGIWKDIRDFIRAHPKAGV